MQEANKLSDRPNATRWVIWKEQLTDAITCVKLRRDDDGEIFISEVVVMLEHRHLRPFHVKQGTKKDRPMFYLPESYEPYIENQWFVITDAEAVDLHDGRQLWHFGPGGIEIRDDKAHLAVPFPVLRRARIDAGLDGMETFVGSEIHAPEIEEESTSGPRFVVLTGPSTIGKSTTVKAANQRGIVAYDLDDYGEKGEEDLIADWHNYTLDRWIKEELSEILTAHTAEERLDGYLDMLGIVYNWMMTEAGDASTLRRAIAAYAKSQKDRDRWSGGEPGWYKPMKHLPTLAKRYGGFESAKATHADMMTKFDQNVSTQSWILNLQEIAKVFTGDKDIFVTGIGSNWRQLFSMLSTRDDIVWYHAIAPSGMLFRRWKERHPKDKMLPSMFDRWQNDMTIAAGKLGANLITVDSTDTPTKVLEKVGLL